MPQKRKRKRNPIYHKGIDITRVDGVDLRKKSDDWYFKDLGYPENDTELSEKIIDVMVKHGSEIRLINARCDFRKKK